jgi:hypothetical protein
MGPVFTPFGGSFSSPAASSLPILQQAARVTLRLSLAHVFMAAIGILEWLEPIDLCLDVGQFSHKIKWRMANPPDSEAAKLAGVRVYLAKIRNQHLPHGSSNLTPIDKAHLRADEKGQASFNTTASWGSLRSPSEMSSSSSTFQDLLLPLLNRFQSPESQADE